MVPRRMTEADVDNPFRLNSGPQVMRYLTGGAAAPPASRSAIVAETMAANEGSELGRVEYLLTRADWLAGRSCAPRRHGSDEAR